MKIKRFQSVCRFLSIILFVSGFITVAAIGVTGISYLFGNRSMEFSLKLGPYALFASMIRGASLTKFQVQSVSWVIATCASLVYFYSCIKGSELFKQLSLGVTPFSTEFVTSLKKISFLLIACDIGIHLSYSLMRTLMMLYNGGGYELVLGFSNSTLIGLAIYCIAGVINYGIELQKLSDDVV